MNTFGRLLRLRPALVLSRASRSFHAPTSISRNLLLLRSFPRSLVRNSGRARFLGKLFYKTAWTNFSRRTLSLNGLLGRQIAVSIQHFRADRQVDNVLDFITSLKTRAQERISPLLSTSLRESSVDGPMFDLSHHGTLGSFLGKGADGVVYDPDPEKDVAVKILFNINDRVQNLLNVENRPQNYQHPNIITISDSFIAPFPSAAIPEKDLASIADVLPESQGGVGGEDTGILLMEKYEGSLRDLFLDNETLTPQTALSIALQLFSAFSYLGDKGIAHRDLRAANILFKKADDDPDAVKVSIADFGCSCEGRGAATSRGDGDDIGGMVMLNVPEISRFVSETRSNSEHREEIDFIKCDAYCLGLVVEELLSKVTAESSAVQTLRKLTLFGLCAANPKKRYTPFQMHVITSLLMWENDGIFASLKIAGNSLSGFFIAVSQWASSLYAFLILEKWKFDDRKMKLSVKLEQLHYLLTSTFADPKRLYLALQPLKGLYKNGILKFES